MNAAQYLYKINYDFHWVSHKSGLTLNSAGQQTSKFICAPQNSNINVVADDVLEAIEKAKKKLRELQIPMPNNNEKAFRSVEKVLMVERGERVDVL